MHSGPRPLGTTPHRLDLNAACRLQSSCSRSCPLNLLAPRTQGRRPSRSARLALTGRPSPRIMGLGRFCSCARESVSSAPAGMQGGGGLTTRSIHSCGSLPRQTSCAGPGRGSGLFLGLQAIGVRHAARMADLHGLARGAGRQALVLGRRDALALVVGVLERIDADEGAACLLGLHGGHAGPPCGGFSGPGRYTASGPGAQP